MNLREESTGQGRIDRAAGIIRDVRVLGRVSRNNREYSDAAMDDVARLAEGATVFVNHDFETKKRKLDDAWGTLKNVYRKGDAVFADLHYLKSHHLTEMILERAERFPDRFGLSHDADGRTSRKGSKMLVESIEQVNSVDLVLRPATNSTLFESEAGLAGSYDEALQGKSFSEAIKSPALPSFASQSRRSRSLREMDEGAIAELPVNNIPDSFDTYCDDVAGSCDSVEELREAFNRALVNAVCDRVASRAVILSKVKRLLEARDQAIAKLEGITKDEEDEPELDFGGGFEAVKESIDWAQLTGRRSLSLGR